MVVRPKPHRNQRSYVPQISDLPDFENRGFAAESIVKPAPIFKQNKYFLKEAKHESL
jgi:hypothetical protein